MVTELALLYPVLFFLSLSILLCSPVATESSSDHTAAITGGVVAVVLIITITVAVVSIAALFLKNCHGNSSTGIDE